MHWQLSFAQYPVADDFFMLCVVNLQNVGCGLREYVSSKPFTGWWLIFLDTLQWNCVLGILSETCSYNLTTKLWEPAAFGILLERENTYRETNKQNVINIFNIGNVDKTNPEAFVMPGPNPSLIYSLITSSQLEWNLNCLLLKSLVHPEGLLWSNFFKQDLFLRCYFS